MIERMNERLGFPDRCPHGWPISPEAERAENAELQSLSDLAAGDGCEIMRLVEHDGDLLHWYYDRGLRAGREALGPRRAARGGAHEGRARRRRDDGAERLIAEKAARGLIVRRLSVRSASAHRA